MQPSDRVRVLTSAASTTRTAAGNAVDLLVRIRRLADVAGNPKGFEELLSRVRAAHRPKRNLTAMLGQKGW